MGLKFRPVEHFPQSEGEGQWLAVYEEDGYLRTQPIHQDETPNALLIFFPGSDFPSFISLFGLPEFCGGPKWNGDTEKPTFYSKIGHKNKPTWLGWLKSGEFIKD